MLDLSRRGLLLLAGAPVLHVEAQAQETRRPPGETQPAAAGNEVEQPDEFRVDTDHPRIFLPQRRVRLLGRERERRSIRWQQFELLMAGRAPMPETGFAQALYYRAGAGDEAGKQAVQWALSAAARDLRQLAIVFDWCQNVMSESQSDALAKKIRLGFERTEKARDVSTIRSRVLAAIALAGHDSTPPDAYLKWVVVEWWRRDIAPALKSGNRIVARDDAYPLIELMHAIRDNTNIEMRDSAAKYFKEWPTQLLLGYYPSAYPAAENEYRIPIYHADGEPDLRLAMLARAADLAMVAYDTNALENQFLQGWLIHDRFLMRGTFGIVYEFLWANPYQPGLSYYHVPMHYHDPSAGLLFLRSSWEEDAMWFAVMNGKMQVFQEGIRSDIDPARGKPLTIGRTTVLFGTDPMRFTANNPEAALTYVVGLKPSHSYEIEIDDEEMTEVTTDRAGLLPLPFPPSVNVGVRLRSVKAPPPK